MNQFGPFGLASIAIAVLVVLALLALVLKLAFSGRGRSRRHARDRFADDSRIEVIETTAIDEERRLVLLRCDDVEHLIVIGGPADLVVENDVRKARTPQQRSAAPAASQPAQTVLPPAPPVASPPVAGPSVASPPVAGPARMPAAMGASLDAAIAAVAPRSADAARPNGRHGEPRPPLSSRPGAAPVVAPPVRSATRPGRNGEAPQREDEPGAGRIPAPRSTATDAARRDAPVQRRTPQPALPQVGRAIEPQRAPAAERTSRRPGTRAEESALPAVSVPWTDPTSIEDEIVQALRSEPQRNGDAAPPPRREITRTLVDPSATLGDLADRLEEALAREIQNVAPAVGTRSEPIAPRPERREPRSEPARQSGGRDSESRREPAVPAERREEAPVISLNARRREAADPIEDEMARLLGELTGDSKGR